MSLHSKILVGHKTATALLGAVDNKDGLCGQRGAPDNDRMVAFLGDARQQANDHLGVGLMHTGPKERQPFAPRFVIQPNVDLFHARPAEQDRIICSAQTGPSRHQRRRQYQSSHAIPPRNLGVIEGERLQRARGYHEDYSLAKNLASLAAVTAVLFCAAVIVGAV
ncbi:hypothetical protein [Mesorhizobium muleiense]|uniref:hypothetical protein n=1 Tax=Mesorhizobium muleiense TaxID=1004279 RepID=UPI001F3B883A|nr:hypothetical protein [Mesorhizobium muleiense]MCF6112347.1 hypothetical protein [Mesorhizobium muleiense]